MDILLFTWFSYLYCNFWQARTRSIEPNDKYYWYYFTMDRGDTLIHILLVAGRGGNDCCLASLDNVFVADYNANFRIVKSQVIRYDREV